MARINVEQKALSDPRFTALARLRKYDDPDLALAKMVRVWNECIERSSYSLPCWVVEAIFCDSDAPADLVTVELAEWESDDRLRIKGTEGRTEYLGDLRAAKVRGGKARAAGASDPMRGVCEHINWFSKRSLEKLLDDVGLRPISYSISKHFNGCQEVWCVLK